MGSKTDPDYRDLQMDTSDIDILKRYVSRCIPGLVPEPAVVESCMYTVRVEERALCGSRSISALKCHVLGVFGLFWVCSVSISTQA